MGDLDRISIGGAPRSDRVYHWFVFVSLFLIAAAIGSAGVSIADEPMGMAFLGSAALLILGTELARRAHRRQIKPGYLVVHAGSLEFNLPELFKQPFTIPIGQVQAVVVDEPADGEWGAGGFPYYGKSTGPLHDRVRGYVWKTGEPFSFRILGRKFRRPNLLILFNLPATPVVYRALPWGPQQKEALSGAAAWTPDPAHAREVLAKARLRQFIREDDLEITHAIDAGAIRGTDPTARSRTETDELSLIKQGWSFAVVGIWLPFLSIWALPIARRAFLRREYAHAVGLTLVALASIGLGVAILTDPPVESSWRYVVGILLTLLMLVRFLTGAFPRVPHKDDGEHL